METIPHRRLSDEIVQQLEQLILNNELRLGDALPPERELAAQLGVSRNILREAISSMVQKGLLEVRQGSGTYVACPSAELLSDSLTFFVHLKDSGLFDLLDARLALEVQIAELGAQRASGEDCRLIEARLRELEEAVDDPDRYVDADVLFHAALAKAAKNEILQLLLDTIRGAMRENIRIVLERHPNAVHEAMHYHRRLADAFSRHSPEDARKTMHEHLASVRRELQELEKLDAQPNLKTQK